MKTCGFFRREIPHPSSGFSLIEIIITLVVVGVFAAMIIPFYNSGVFNSITYTKRQEAVFQLNSVLADIVADYENSGTQIKISELEKKIRKRINDTLQEDNITLQEPEFKRLKIAGSTTYNGLRVTLKKKPDIEFSYLFVTKEPAP